MEPTPQPKKRKKKWVRWMIAGIVAHTVLEVIATILILVYLLEISTAILSVSDSLLDPMASAEPVTQTLQNGDTFYTPGYPHAVRDEGHTVMYYDNLLVVFTKTDLTPHAQQDLADLIEGEVVGSVAGGAHAVQILVPEADLEQLLSLCNVLMDDPDVMYACPEYPVQILGDPEEILSTDVIPEAKLWWQEAIDVRTAWEYAKSCQDVKIGIVDNGFYDTHTDLDGQITFISNEDFNSADDHGTHVAGIIAAKHNGTGIRGIAPQGQLYCADVWPDWYSFDSYHTMTELVAVINAMAQEGVRVVNHSWGAIIPSKGTYLYNRYGYVDPWKQLFDNSYPDYLQQRRDEELIPTAEASAVMISQLIHSGYGDLIMVQAAGNGYDNGMEGCDASYNGFFSRIDEQLYQDLDPRLRDTLTEWGITYEQIDDRIIIVGAVRDAQDINGRYRMTAFSNYGSQIDICAPGGDILSCIDPEMGGYESYDGTSMAAPMVTGSVAYLYSLDPSLTPEEVKALLLENATQAVGVGEDKGTVYPMLNLGKAAQALMG